MGQDVGAHAALVLQSSLTCGVIQYPVPPIQSGGCPDVASSRRHLNSRDGNSRGHPRSSGGRQRSATRRGKTGAPVTRQGREQALVSCTPLSPHLSLLPSLHPSPPASFILAVSRSIPRLRSERWCVQHSNESTALLQSPEKGPH